MPKIETWQHWKLQVIIMYFWLCHFDLTNGPFVYQRVTDKALGGLHSTISVVADYVIMLSTSISEEIRLLELVIHALE